MCGDFNIFDPAGEFFGVGASRKEDRDRAQKEAAEAQKAAQAAKAETTDTKEEDKRRRAIADAAAKKGRRSTFVTGGQGLGESGAVARPTLGA